MIVSLSLCSKMAVIAYESINMFFGMADNQCF